MASETLQYKQRFETSDKEQTLPIQYQKPLDQSDIKRPLAIQYKKTLGTADIKIFDTKDCLQIRYGKHAKSI